jgi:hypothetical protein
MKDTDVMHNDVTQDAAATLALQSLGFILADAARAERFLALTGLTPEILRTGANRTDMLVAILDFLLGHEPDLLLCAGDLGIAPGKIGAARAALSPVADFAA